MSLSKTLVANRAQSVREARASAKSICVLRAAQAGDLFAME
ncbi:MAG: hypothetical protein ABI633_09760 [Burkholderiales bacterium]